MLRPRDRLVTAPPDEDQLAWTGYPSTFEPLLKITNALIPSTNGPFGPIERTTRPPPNTANSLPYGRLTNGPGGTDATTPFRSFLTLTLTS